MFQILLLSRLGTPCGYFLLTNPPPHVAPPWLSDSLHYSSAASIALAVIFVIITIIITIINISFGTIQSPRWLPNFSTPDAVMAVFACIPVSDERRDGHSSVVEKSEIVSDLRVLEIEDILSRYSLSHGVQWFIWFTVSKVCLPS